MTDPNTLGKSLIEDLEAIRESLDRIARSKPGGPAVPVVDEVVDKREATPLNPDNPFLSSESLSELIRIRNEAEARAAQELADQQTAEVQLDPQFEAAFNAWADKVLPEYVALFERDLRHRLRADFKKLLDEQRQPGPDDSA